MNRRRERKLPLWAQDVLADLRQLLERKQTQLDQLERVHAVLHDRAWLTINGPSDSDHCTLFVLQTNQALPVCSLYKNDILLVGRSKEKQDE